MWEVCRCASTLSGTAAEAGTGRTSENQTCHFDSRCAGERNGYQSSPDYDDGASSTEQIEIAASSASAPETPERIAPNWETATKRYNGREIRLPRRTGVFIAPGDQFERMSRRRLLGSFL